MLGSITLKYEGKVRKIRDIELDTRLIGKVFNLYPDSIVLVNEDGLVETASREDGRFRDLSDFIEYYVEGHDLDHIPTPNLSATSSVSLSSGTPHQAKNATPKFSLKAKKPQPTNNSAQTSSPEEEMNKTVEIHRMIDDELRRQDSYSITLKPFSVNVDHISSVVSIKVFDGAPVVLLDNDNYQIFDSATTQNMKYWKGTRNIKAVTEGDYSNLSDLRNSMLSKGKLKAGPPVKKYKVDTRFKELESKLSSMEYKIRCFDNLEATKERLVAENGQLTASLKELEAEIHAKCTEITTLQKVVDTVKANPKCIICHSLMVEGVVLPCCDNYGCCHTCVERWLFARKTCPHCRADLLIGNCINVPLTRQLSNIISAIGDHVLDDTSV